MHAVLLSWFTATMRGCGKCAAGSVQPPDLHSSLGRKHVTKAVAGSNTPPRSSRLAPGGCLIPETSHRLVVVCTWPRAIAACLAQAGDTISVRCVCRAKQEAAWTKLHQLRPVKHAVGGCGCGILSRFSIQLISALMTSRLRPAVQVDERAVHGQGPEGQAGECSCFAIRSELPQLVCLLLGLCTAAAGPVPDAWHWPCH